MLKYAALSLLLTWPAGAQDHYTFSQWERLQDDDRVAFIAVTCRCGNKSRIWRARPKLSLSTFVDLS
jgi:hypothetical protein